MPKKTILPIIVIILLALAVTIFIYRYNILRYSADAIIRSLLPSYVRVDKIDFDARSSRVTLYGFKILNPRAFRYEYLLEIGSIVCEYRLKGKTILEGFEVMSPVFKDAVLDVERRSDGKINLVQMPEVIESARDASQGASKEKDRVRPKKESDVKIYNILRLPKTYQVKNGKVLFIDGLHFRKAYEITLENIDASMTLILDETYTKVMSSSSQGEGLLNGRRGEVVKWNVGLNPNTPKLTMSNRLEIYDADILTFEPYYDRFSPFVFKTGKFSGTLVFDFNNGSIGSMNEIRLSDFRFYVKPGYENAQYFQTSVQDLAKYFTSPFGEIVFDFKIKGDMDNPEFLLGPLSKKAISSMVIDKITSAIGNVSGSEQASASSGSSDLDKAKEYIELFQKIVNKK